MKVFWVPLLPAQKELMTSGKELALLPTPPLRTGLESFPSSGSDHNQASGWEAGITTD